MCKCLAGNVACCCFNCALSVLISIISAFLVVFIIAGVLIWYFYYYQEEDDATKFKNNLQDTWNDGVGKIKDAFSR